MIDKHTIYKSEDYKAKYEKLKEFVRGKWKGECAECAAIANEIFNKEQADVAIDR